MTTYTEPTGSVCSAGSLNGMPQCVRCDGELAKQSTSRDGELQRTLFGLGAFCSVWTAHANCKYLQSARKTWVAAGPPASRGRGGEQPRPRPAIDASPGRSGQGAAPSSAHLPRNRLKYTPGRGLPREWENFRRVSNQRSCSRFDRKSARLSSRRRNGRLTSQGNPCCIQGGLKLTSVDIKRGRTPQAASSRQLP
jgi:hypothetical protein